MESTQNQSFAFQLIMDSTAREENGKLLSQNLYDKIETLKLKSMWMSRKMAECLEDLGMFINILEGDKIDFIRNKRNEPMIKPHSNSYFRYFEFSAIQKQLLKVYFEDITSLDDIDSFRKESLYTLTLFEKAYKENLEKDRQNPAIKALLDENYETMTDKLRQEYDETKGKTGEGHE